MFLSLNFSLIFCRYIDATTSVPVEIPTGNNEPFFQIVESSTQRGKEKLCDVLGFTLTVKVKLFLKYHSLSLPLSILIGGLKCFSSVSGSPLLLLLLIENLIFQENKIITFELLIVTSGSYKLVKLLEWWKTFIIVLVAIKILLIIIIIEIIHFILLVI